MAALTSQSSASSESQCPNASNNFVLHKFSNTVAFRLDEDNFLPWKDQAKATIEGYRLMKYVKGQGICHWGRSSLRKCKWRISKLEAARFAYQILASRFYKQVLHHSNSRVQIFISDLEKIGGVFCFTNQSKSEATQISTS